MNTGILFAIAAATTWGLVYTIDQKLLASASATTLLLADALITAAILLPVAIRARQPIMALLSSGATTAALVTLSVLLAALANYFIFSSIRLTDASIASTVEIAYPFFVVLFSFVLFDQPLNPGVLIGGLIIYIGATIVILFH